MTYSSLAKCLPNLKMPTQTATNIFGAIWPPSQQSIKNQTAFCQKPFAKSSKKNGGNSETKTSLPATLPKPTTEESRAESSMKTVLFEREVHAAASKKIVRGFLIVSFWKQITCFTQSPLALPMAPWMLMVQSGSTHTQLMHLEGDTLLTHSTWILNQATSGRIC